jgi:hypothetical protein
VTTYRDEIEQLRPEFAAVDKSDPVSLKQWFESHSHLRTSDHARIANRDLDYIRRLKKLAGLGGRTPKNRPTNSNKKIVSIDVPEVWDDPEWLRKIIQLHSAKSLAKAIGVSVRTISCRLIKYKIPRKSPKERTKPNNPCCTKAWVYEHYVEQGLSQSKCGKLAGITHGAFAKWLIRFEIPVRDIRETRVKQKQVKVWCRKLLERLQNQPIVRRCYIRHDHIHVRFHNYYWETYYPDKSVIKGNKNAKTRIPRSFEITKDTSRLEHVPPVLCQYESDFDSDAYQAHIIIPMVQWKKASFIERRLCVHEFARQITRRGWIDPNYPNWVLDQEWSKLQNLNPAKYLRKGGIFTAFPSYGTKPPPGRRLIEQFFDFHELWETIRSPRWTIKALNNMVSMSKLEAYDTHQFYRSVMYTSNKDAPRVLDPGFYSILWKRLGIRGKVLDLTPNHGTRAVGCAMTGLTYVTLPSQKVQTALDRGLSDFTGLNYEEYDGGKVDLVILDNDLRKCSIDDAMKYASKTRNILVFVPRNEKHAMQAKYKPSSIIQVKARCYGNTPDFIFVW